MHCTSHRDLDYMLMKRQDTTIDPSTDMAYCSVTYHTCYCPPLRLNFNVRLRLHLCCLPRRARLFSALFSLSSSWTCRATLHSLGLTLSATEFRGVHHVIVSLPGPVAPKESPSLYRQNHFLSCGRSTPFSTGVSGIRHSRGDIMRSIAKLAFVSSRLERVR